MPSVRLSTASVGIQPAAGLRHVQRHGHVPHVLRALLPVACPTFEPSPARCVHRGRPPPPGHTSYRSVCPPCDSAGRKLPVQRQQAAHPLRVGGHLGLRLCWLRLELGFGKLLAKLSPHRGERDWAASAATTRSTPARNLHVAEAYTDMRGEGVKKRLRRADNRRSAALPDKCRSTCVGVSTGMRRRSAAATMARTRGATTALDARSGRSPPPHGAWEGGVYDLHCAEGSDLGVSIRYRSYKVGECCRWRL